MSVIKEAFQAGVEVGRNMMKMEVEALAKFDAAGFTQFSPADYADKPVAGKRPGRIAKAAAKTGTAPAKAPKAPVVARGVKASGGPKAKGVKQAILALIAADGANGGITTRDILAKLPGLKANSVNSTLMGLKKSGLAMQDGKLWLPAGANSDSGMRDSESHSEAAGAEVW
jgi:hypothetical protein